MPRRTPPPPAVQPTVWSRVRIQISLNRQREILALLIGGVGALTLLSLFGFGGSLTLLWASLLTRFVGVGAYALAVAFLFAAISLLRREENVFDEFPIAWGRIVALEIMFAAGLALVHLWLARDDRAALQLAEAGDGGGYLGLALSSLTTRSLGTPLGATLLALICIVMLRFVFDLRPLGAALIRALESIKPAPRPVEPSVLPVQRRPAPVSRSTSAAPVNRVELMPRPAMPAIEEDEDEEELDEIAPNQQASAQGNGKHAPTEVPARPPLLSLRPKPAGAKETAAVPEKPVRTYDPLLAVPRTKMRRRAGRLPNVADLFQESAEATYAQSSAQAKAQKIEETLDHFGIPAKVIDINAGPTITQFAVEPGFIERRALDGQIRNRKVPVSRILSLSNDLALALAAAPIRIEAPVPGRSYVGIEVPNEQISLVSLRGVMESEPYKKLKAKATLPIALGRDVSGAPAVADLATMPHLLIAGATGSGKSVCVNTIIACLLCNYSPDQLRMVMVDPKRVELVNFNGIPHLLGPVITDVAQVVPALRWATQLMDARFHAFSKEGARNIEAYNAKMDKSGGDRLPYVLIMIDELADLMLAAPDETERFITRLAQMARATGIHLVLATQRPSVDVVTGLIKANFPARISFAVTSSVDSRVVLDTPGAEKLLGKGDMLYMAPDSAKLARLQGCFVSDDELARLTKYWRDQQEEFDYIPTAPWEMAGATGEAGSNNGKDSGDELIEQAIELIRGMDRASISLLQRKLGIGYPRAARLMDQLEERGVVGPDEGGKPRAILMPQSKKSGKQGSK